MLTDGYFDMSAYIFGRLKKETLYATLTATKSKYAVLYKKSYPRSENAVSTWNNFEFDPVENLSDNKEFLTYDEASAIVNWVYRTLKSAEEREKFTKELFHQLKEFYGIKNKIRFSNGIVYNSEKVEIHFLSSISQVNTFLANLKITDNTIFFRGHSNANYSLLPSIMRTSQLAKNESLLYNELLINCPEDFEKCHTHLEKLVKMQHYGLPTRLLDITRNPLVALYFACEDHHETYGELVLISAKNKDIKYPQSDTVSILASLAVFNNEKQNEFADLASDTLISDIEFNEGIARLIHEVRLEKPAFQAEVNKMDVLRNYIVYALKNNNRIVKQDGAFVLCGLSANTGSLEDFRYREKGKKVVVLINNKKTILERLETFSINRASLFPEIECVSEYLKNKYNK